MSQNMYLLCYIIFLLYGLRAPFPSANPFIHPSPPPVPTPMLVSEFKCLVF